MTDATCRECDKPAWADGLCHSHHVFWARNATPEERFWVKVDKNGPLPERHPELGPCWVWTGATNKKSGYGVFRLPRERRTVGAHRWGYETFVGSIPEGLHLDHLCHNAPCVRPDHLEPVTSGENMRRGDAPVAQVLRTGLCMRGLHPMNEAYVMATGGRHCRQCSLEKQQSERRNPDSARHRLKVNPDAKYRQLTAEQVEQIRQLWALGGIRQWEIAAMFGCTQPTVSAIVNRRRLETRPAPV